MCSYACDYQVGALESSKSAMKTLAPELSALMTILRSTGPVISTRLSWMSSGMGATCAVTTCLAVRLLDHFSGAVPCATDSDVQDMVSSITLV
jgi:hypothetical protein